MWAVRRLFNLFFWSVSLPIVARCAARYFGKLNGRAVCCFKLGQPDENPAKLNHASQPEYPARGLYIAMVHISTSFPGRDKGSEFFIAGRMPAVQALQRLMSLNYEVDLTTFAVADNLFDRAIIKLNNFRYLNNVRRCFYNRYWLIYS
ncbi:hypothetical protein LL999_26850 [Burkholderia ambifaria]|uniref:hypothetical protein n=1 Tax=Burkholderia ambifaria TaxID=152480 RepID=UPI001E32D9E6|nr:hypothetical protein [Burkholderia ambifaria]UEP23835.1 hypothetical protein LL999_26850 [Burkholderia ambifaria]